MHKESSREQLISSGVKKLAFPANCYKLYRMHCWRLDGGCANRLGKQQMAVPATAVQKLWSMPSGENEAIAVWQMWNRRVFFGGKPRGKGPQKRDAWLGPGMEELQTALFLRGKGRDCESEWCIWLLGRGNLPLKSESWSRLSQWWAMIVWRYKHKTVSLF